MYKSGESNENVIKFINEKLKELENENMMDDYLKGNYIWLMKSILTK